MVKVQENGRFLPSLTGILALIGLHLCCLHASLDLNPQEIEFVADHLTDEKCAELIKVLHVKSFRIDTSRTITPNVTEDTSRPCVVQLTQWCSGAGKKKTFDFLALRLKEIGLPKLAGKLSKTVLHETADELHRFFLDDPFKDLAPTESFMVNKPQEEFKEVVAPDAEDKHESLFVSVVILSTICLSCCFITGVCLACPNVGHFVCLRACPSTCYLCYEAMADSCRDVVGGVKRSANKYMLVAPKGGEGMLV